MIRKLLMLAMMLFIVGVTNTQAQDYRKKADKQFKLKAYELAAYNYNLVLSDQPDNAEVKARLGVCFYYLNNNLQSVKYLQDAGKEIMLNRNELLAFGHAAKKLADYDLSRDAFGQLSEIDPVQGNHFLLSCDYAEKLLKESESYKFYTFGGNTDFSDFGAVAFRDHWVFASFRNDLTENSQAKIPGVRLFSTGKIISKDNTVSPLGTPIKDDYQLGPISYAGDLGICAIMKNPMKERYLPVFADDQNASILLAEVTNTGDYKNALPFRYNEAGSSTAFPALAFDGSALYFCSNRQGGYGGFDIYVSYRKNGEWTVPENLGPSVNTPGNEISPYFDDHTLYFASDYLHGLGGYDIFKSEVYNGSWAYPSNMGNGVNSPGDEITPYVDRETGKIYFSSNRLGSKGGYDIYVAYKDIEANIEAPEKQEMMVSALTREPEMMPIARSVSMNEKNSRLADEPELIPEKVEDFNFNSSDFDDITDFTAENFLVDNYEEAIPKAHVLSTVSEVSAFSPSNWEGATMVSLDEKLIAGTPVYFIQIAALSRSSAKAMKFTGLSRFGNIYTKQESNYTKVRLGYFLDEWEAKQALNAIKAEGFKDAFITKQQLNTSDMELIVSNHDSFSNDSYMVPTKFKGSSSYKVRLASYEDPTWFDISRAKDVGKIEQWTKGGWTIFIASGFASQDEAKRARIKAINKGFVDAEIVFDNNGILEKVKKN